MNWLRYSGGMSWRFGGGLWLAIVIHDGRRSRLHFGSHGWRQVYAGCKAHAECSSCNCHDGQAYACCIAHRAAHVAMYSGAGQGSAGKVLAFHRAKKIAPHKAGRFQSRRFRYYLEMSEPKL